MSTTLANTWIDSSTGDMSLDGDLTVLGTFTGSQKFGGISDYTSFDTTGHQTMVGGAQPWTDVRIEPVARTTGINAPSFAQWFTNGSGSRGVYLYTFDDAALNNQKEIFFTLQMPHEWNQDDIHMHIHWIASTTAASSKVRWGLEYNWAEPGVAYGNTTIIYADTVEGGATGTTQYKHEITEFTALSPSTSQDGLSSILIGRIFRNSAADEDTYTGDAGLLYIDAHFQLNSLGSTDEYTK